MDFTKKPSLNALSIGPGILGIERGIERHIRLKHIAFLEIEAFIIENLVAEMEAGILDPAVIWSDAKTFPAHLFRGKIDLIIAGYPCQPFSNAGNRKGTEDPRHLYPHIERTIAIIRPGICFFENVRGHVTLGLREVIASLEGLGYRVHWGIFSAEETGASHKRERVFIMAVRKDLLGNTDNEPCYSSRGRLRGEFDPASKNMANSYHNGERTQSGDISSQSKATKGEEQRQERNEILWQRSGAESCNGSESQMGNSTEQGLPITRQGGFRELQTEDGERLYDRPEQSGKSEELGDSSGNIERRERKYEQQRSESIGGSGYVANAKRRYSYKNQYWGQVQKESGEGVYNRPEQSGKYVGQADSFSPGLERFKKQPAWQELTTSERSCGQIGELAYPNVWRSQQWNDAGMGRFRKQVARPGEDQYPWEHPRVIAREAEHEVGMPTHGYNIREDVLRALGNSVYPPTAELAWRTLMNKFL